MLLRTAVGATLLRWPERSLAIRVEGPAAPAVILATTGAWPAWASPSGLDSPLCDDSGGLEMVGDDWVLACSGLPTSVPTPGEVAVIRYRSPREVTPGSLELNLILHDAALQPIAVPGATLLAR